MVVVQRRSNIASVPLLRNRTVERDQYLHETIAVLFGVKARPHTLLKTEQQLIVTTAIGIRRSSDQKKFTILRLSNHKDYTLNTWSAYFSLIGNCICNTDNNRRLYTTENVVRRAFVLTQFFKLRQQFELNVASNLERCLLVIGEISSRVKFPGCYRKKTKLKIW